MAASDTLAPARTEPVVPASRRARRPVALLTVSYLVAAILAVPLVFLLIEAQGAGASRCRASHLPAADRLAAVEHRPAHRRGHGGLRGDRDRRRLVRRAHRPARPPGLGGARGGAAGHPRLRGELRLELPVDLGARLPGRGHRDDPGRLPAGLPAGGGQPAQRGSRPGGGGPQPRARAGSAPSPGSRSARPRAPSWAAACWSRWSCWPSTGRSRSSGSRPSPPRSSPSSTATASPPPVRFPWCWWCSACSCWPAKAAARPGAGSAGPVR